MTVAEFLEFDDGTDTRHELAAGELVAMSPPNVRHTVLVRNLFRALDRALSPPCWVFSRRRRRRARRGGGLPVSPTSS
jgi:Uma2 family endonuclease